MHISDFDYELPPHLIAREPVRPRDASRMMVVHRREESIVDSEFKNLPEFLQPGDVLVINDTRVIKARIFGRLERSTGTSRDIEVLFANRISANEWEVLCKPGKRARPGDRIVFGDGAAVATIGDNREHGLRLLEVAGSTVDALLETFGHIPIPPYLERADQSSDSTEYQTVFAENPGAVAAPTAGLHFTPAIFETLAGRGIEVVKITLHVGIGTFLPIRDEDPRRHQLKPEWFSISEDAARRLNAAHEAKRRIVGVGTTSTRTLEYVAGLHGEIRPGSGYADIYITSGYRFQMIDALLTNFHLPRSTLLVLVSAFASREFILNAYAHAVQNGYRFYSYGDCMLIV